MCLISMNVLRGPRHSSHAVKTPRMEGTCVYDSMNYIGWRAALPMVSADGARNLFGWTISCPTIFLTMFPS